LSFGVGKEQNAKLQYKGQGKDFYGRENLRGPGGYEPDTGYLDHNPNGSISGLKIKKNVIMPK
jgi:hypothetical protein